jgi:hypothetical protein
MDKITIGELKAKWAEAEAYDDDTGAPILFEDLTWEDLKDFVGDIEAFREADVSGESQKDSDE